MCLCLTAHAVDQEFDGPGCSVSCRFVLFFFCFFVWFESWLLFTANTSDRLSTYSGAVVCRLHRRTDRRRVPAALSTVPKQPLVHKRQRRHGTVACPSSSALTRQNGRWAPFAFSLALFEIWGCQKSVVVHTEWRQAARFVAVQHCYGHGRCSYTRCGARFGFCCFVARTPLRCAAPRTTQTRSTVCRSSDVQRATTRF